MPTLVASWTEVENDFYVDGPKYGESPRWKYFIVTRECREFESPKRKTRGVIRKTNVLALTGNTKDEVDKALLEFCEGPDVQVLPERIATERKEVRA